MRRRLQAAIARGLTRFVGRQPECDAVLQALARAEAGHGQVVAIVGEAGVGKSRLVYEVVHARHTQEWLVLESASVSYGKAIPYFPVIELLKHYVHIEDSDDVRAMRAKVTGQVLTLDDALQDTLPALLALLDVLPDDSPFLKLDPPQRRQRTLEALKRLLLRESQAQPLLLVFEDLHWIDAETQAFLDLLVDSLPTTRVLLLVNYRPEYQHGWGSKTSYTQLRLDPLPPASAAEVLQALLGDDRSLAPLKQLLIARTEGNPFFLEESVRTLVETQVLVGEPGAYRLAQALPTIQVPATVQAVLAARIDRLPPEDKRLLQTAAVIGHEVPLPLVQSIAELSEATLHRGLAHLQAAEFLYETQLFPEREFVFKHALTHEVAYGSLLQERRRVLHARIVEALEALYADRLAEQVDRLAHHAVRGEVWDKAVTYCRQAGAKAAVRSAHHEAVACFEQALAALAQLPECQDTLAQAIDLRCDLHNALMPLDEQTRIFDHLHAAEALAERLDDPAAARTGRQLSVHLFQRPWASMTVPLRWVSGPSPWPCQRRLRCPGHCSNLSGPGLPRCGGLSAGAGCVAAGDGIAHRRTPLCAPGPGRPARLIFPCLCSLVSGRTGGLRRGHRPGRRRGAAGRGIEQPYSIAGALAPVGCLYRRQGVLHQAIPALERGLAALPEQQHSAFLPLTASPSWGQRMPLPGALRRPSHSWTRCWSALPPGAVYSNMLLCSPS